MRILHSAKNAGDAICRIGSCKLPILRDIQQRKPTLAGIGFDQGEVAAVVGGNWLRFFEQGFGPKPEAAG